MDDSLIKIHVALKDFERNGAILQMFSVSKESLNDDETAALSASSSPAGKSSENHSLQPWFKQVSKNLVDRVSGDHGRFSRSDASHLCKF